MFENGGYTGFDEHLNMLTESLTLTEGVDFGREEFFQWKARMCKNLGIDILFEDMPEVIHELDDSTIAFVAFDPELGTIGYEDEVRKGA